MFVCTNMCAQIVIVQVMLVCVYIYIYMCVCVCVIISKCLSACVDGWVINQRSSWETNCLQLSWEFLFLSCGAAALLGPRSRNCWDFEIAHRHTTFCRIPLDEGSARRNICKRRTSLLPVLLEPTVPAGERPQTARPLGSVSTVWH